MPKAKIKKKDETPKDPKDKETKDEGTPETVAATPNSTDIDIDAITKTIAENVTAQVTKNMSSLFTPKIDSEVDPKDERILEITNKYLSDKIPKEKLDSLDVTEKEFLLNHPEYIPKQEVKKTDSVADTAIPLTVGGETTNVKYMGTEYSPEQVELYNFGDKKHESLPFAYRAYDSKMTAADLGAKAQKALDQPIKHTVNGLPLGKDKKPFTYVVKDGKIVIPEYDKKGYAFYSEGAA